MNNSSLKIRKFAVRKHFRMYSGQVLLEAVVALSILVLVLAAISIVIIVSVNNSSFIKNQNTSNKYAQQGMEQIRVLRDTNLAGPRGFNTFDGIDNCMDSNNILWSSIECTALPSRQILDNQYIRQVFFEKLSPECPTTGGPGTAQTKVTVTVRWSSPKCPGGSTSGRYCHKAEVTSCFEAQPITL